MAELSDEERRELRALHNRVFGEARLRGVSDVRDGEGELTEAVILLEHPSFESAQVSMAVNRVEYGHGAVVEQGDCSQCVGRDSFLVDCAGCGGTGLQWLVRVTVALEGPDEVSPYPHPECVDGAPRMRGVSL